MQHIKRWITALILGPLVLWVIVKGNTLLLAVLVSIVAILAVREYLRIVFKTGSAPLCTFIRVISHITSMTLIIGACLGSWEIEFLILAMNLAVLSFFVLYRFAGDPAIFDSIAKQVLGIVYIPVSLSVLVFIKELDGGILWIIWLLIVIFANDTGAFYSGTFFGKNALAPRISPNKTIEGSIGGMAASMGIGFITCILFFHDLSLAFLVLPASFLLSAAGQAGDLFESAMKRSASIKDSGCILPGHGGMLDRIDGLLMAVPVLYIYLKVVL